jgi:hypothetical protein
MPLNSFPATTNAQLLQQKQQLAKLRNEERTALLA